MNFRHYLKCLLAVALAIFLNGCTATYPKDFLKLSAASLEIRQLQTKQYETANEAEVISAGAGVLQDLGFNIDDSETSLGLVVGSKDRDATDAGQVAMATISTVFSLLGGSSSDALERIDRVQKIRASVVMRPSSDAKKMLVRVSFQRIVWNARGDVTRMETLKDPLLYQGFFERLSKSIFLEAQEI